MLRDKQIHPARIRFQAATIRSGKIPVDALRRQPELQNPLCPIVSHLRGPEDLRKFAIGIPAEQIHLPQAILCGHVSLGNPKVLLVGRANVGHAVGVALYGNSSRQPTGIRACASQLDFAIEHRQRGFGGSPNPQQTGTRPEKQQQTNANP